MNKNNLTKIILILIALVGTAILGWLILSGSKTPKTAEMASNPEQKLEAPIEVSSGILLTRTQNQEQAPPGFPDIPLNAKIKVNNSYSLTYKKSGSEQKVIDFTSSKSVKENFVFYKSWAEKNGWKVMHQLDNAKESRLIIEKDKKPLNITIQKDAGASSKINVSF